MCLWKLPFDMFPTCYNSKVVPAFPWCILLSGPAWRHHGMHHTAWVFSLQTHINHCYRLQHTHSVHLTLVLLSGDAIILYWVHSGAVFSLFRKIFHSTSTELRKKAGWLAKSEVHKTSIFVTASRPGEAAEPMLCYCLHAYNSKNPCTQLYSVCKAELSALESDRTKLPW